MEIIYQIKEVLKGILPAFLINKYHLVLAFLAALFCGFPSRKLKVIGVTGTKGKTTTCYLIYQLLNSAGLKTGLTSSVFFGNSDRLWLNKTKHGMPGRFKLQRLLALMKKAGCRYAVIETTSEGILQHRHRFVDYQVAVFTNLAPEHLERHKGFENYRAAKLKLFEKVARKEDGVGVYNLDDENADWFLGPEIREKWGYGIKLKVKSEKLKVQVKSQKFRILEIEDIQLGPKETKFKIGDNEFATTLIGEFNVYNASAAICVALSQGVTMEKIREALPRVKLVPGRLELIDEGQDFTVIIDYAHEPLSLETAYKTAKEVFKPQRMICLLGSQGGGRDKWKRPKMGQIAAKYCDEIILTDEDPYDENPLKIIGEIESGFSSNPKSKIQNPKSWKILDRREAIRKALSLAKKDDLVVLTGKAGEVWMCVAHNKKIPWDEKQVVKEELQKLKN
jgi:UDP-N-acetylmuramoyl-L-alanyl-D-glutamate--2,6-diaminopimelate ligase